MFWNHFEMCDFKAASSGASYFVFYSREARPSNQTTYYSPGVMKSASGSDLSPQHGVNDKQSTNKNVWGELRNLCLKNSIGNLCSRDGRSPFLRGWDSGSGSQDQR